MKTNSIVVIGAVALSFASAIHTFAIEGLQVSVQCSNVVLAWPSIEGKSYIVQYRQTLNATDSWQTLTSSLTAASETNVTFFVHSNIVQNPCSGCDGNSFAGMDYSENALSVEMAAPIVPMLMAIPTNGTGDGVPVVLYPPGFDLSGFIIFDPVTGESVSGAGYSTRAFSLDSPLLDDPVPSDDGGYGENGGPTPALETGFYQVAQDGVQIRNSTMAVLTNGVLSNNVTIAFEAGNAANDGTGTNVLGNLECAALLIDGTKFAGDGGVLGSPSNTVWRFDMDTAYLENGTHNLQLAVTWLNPDNSDGNHVNITRYSDPVTITVSNQIYYPNWEPEIGEMGISAYFAKTTCTNADWTIDIYDASGNFVQRLTGHTTDGAIEAYWNMVDTNGVTRTNADVDPEFSSIITVSDPASKTAPKKKQRWSSWPDHGKWVVAYQDFFKFEYSPNNYMQGSINNYANTTAKYGGYYLYYPQPGQTNDIGQTYPMRYQKTNHWDSAITPTALFLDDQLLRIFLARTNSRNFFYDGHGDANSIGDNIDLILLKATIQHRYRFAMLDSCSSANGALNDAFGIHGPGRFAQTYYHNTGIRPGAFCGYNEDVDYSSGGQVTIDGVTYDDTIPSDVSFFIFNFIFYWDSMGYRLNDSIQDASDNCPTPGGFNDREDHWEIYGYDDLRIDEDNYRWSTW